MGRIIWLFGVICLVFAAGRVEAQSGSLTIGTTEPLANLDPADSGDFFNWALLAHLYTGLTRQKPGSLEFELALAETHTVSDDGLTHTFVLRPDAAFSDGRPITAQTFADSINRAIRLRGRGISVIAPYVHSVTVVNGALALRFIAPRSPDFVRALIALPPYFPTHPISFPAGRLERAPDNPITNGVYRVEAREPGRLALVADPAWRGEPPQTREITLRSYELPADLRAALKAGEVDLAWRVVTHEDVEDATRTGAIQVVRAPGMQAFYLLIGQDEPPFDDPIARRALLYLLDRERATRLGLNGTAAPLYTLLPPPLASEGAARYPAFDLDQGLAVLAEGGYSNLKRIEADLQLSRPLYGDLYAAAADALINILARQEAFRIGRFDIEPTTFREQIERGAFRLAIIGWTPAIPHPDAYLRALLAGEIAAENYRNPQIAAALDQAMLESDPAKVAALYEGVQALAAEDIFAIPLWQALQTALIGPTIDPASVVIELNYLLHLDSLAQR